MSGRKPRHFLISVLVALVFALGLVNQTSQGVASSRFLYTEKVVYENRGSASLPLAEEDRAVSLFFNSSFQTVRIYNISRPITRYWSDEDGNPAGEVLPSAVPGHSNMTVTTVYEITKFEMNRPQLRRDLSQDVGEINVSSFRGGNEVYQTDDKDIVAKARELAGNKTRVLDVVDSLIGYIASNVVYDYDSETPKYPNETLKELSGDCDDQSILLITMCRILGIPSYLQVGCVFRNDLEADSTVIGGHLRLKADGVGWHGWAMIYIPPWGWLPADMTYVTSLTGLVPEIEHAAILERNVIAQLNISNYDWVGLARQSQKELLESSLYIYVEMSVQEVAIDTGAGFSNDYIVPIVIGGSLVGLSALALWLSRKR